MVEDERQEDRDDRSQGPVVALLGPAPAASHDRPYLFRPLPIGQRIQCRINRRKQGVGALYPQYDLFEESSDGSRMFLLAARRKKKTRGAQYLISRSRVESGPTEFERGAVGKVRSNFFGTLFTVYETGRADGSRNELAAVMYEPNVMGIRGPRRMCILLPGVTKDDCIKELPYQGGHCRLHEKAQSEDTKGIIVIRNKYPTWSEELQSYVLNFSSRVSQASVKNFQIAPDFDLDYVVLQFGKTGPNSFSMDFQYPLSALQAFGICLTSLDPKLICE